jgi:hypothetical protein
MSVSYPYFSIAKEFNIDYSIVLKFVEELENKTDPGRTFLEVWETSILAAYFDEKERRKTVNSV